MPPIVPLFPGIPGGIEVFVVLLIIVLLFGANKLPKLARSSGQAMGEFKKGREEMENELSQMKGETMGTDDEEAPPETTTTPSTSTPTDTTAEADAETEQTRDTDTA